MTRSQARPVKGWRVAVDDRTVFVRGNTGQAVRASSSIPGVFEPVKIAGSTYVDGGEDEETNDRMIENLRRELKGVRTIAVRGGAMQAQLEAALRHPERPGGEERPLEEARPGGAGVAQRVRLVLGHAGVLGDAADAQPDHPWRCPSRNSWCPG